MRGKGICFTMLSAVIFGFLPVLVKIAYDGGASSAAVIFLRASLSLPLMALVLRRQGVPLRLEPGQPAALLLTSSNAMTTLLLGASYRHISAGLATTLHFIYPMLIVAACALFFKERMSGRQGAALALSLAGVALFLEPGGQTAALWGMALALLSGFTYAFYVILIDKSGLKELHYLKLSLYVNAVMAVCSFACGLAMGELRFDMSPLAWACCLVISLLSCLGATPLFQLGVRYIGASTAAILSTFEPITSIVFGFLLLGEQLSWGKVAGCALILAGVVLVSLRGRRARSPETAAPEKAPTPAGGPPWTG
mgnify:CR=1 FL=1